MALVDKLRRAREFQVETGGFTFTLRRPTDVEWLELVESGKSTARTVLAYIVGWEGVKEIDLIPGGDPHPLPFDAVACADWISDRIDLLPPLLDGFMKSYESHLAARADAQKN